MSITKTLAATVLSTAGILALAFAPTPARAADVDVYRVAPPYYGPPDRVVVVRPGPRCYWRVQRVWVGGTLVTRRVRRCW